MLQDENGNIELTHSVSAGLDYAAIGPEHAALRDAGRISYCYATDAAGARRLCDAGADAKASCRRSSRLTRSPRWVKSPAA